MKTDFMPRHRQAPGEFNDGEILEYRPVIPDHNIGGFKSYTNLFYWAHAWSDEGSTIGLHPHKGFEIMSYVVKGSLEHYDTLLKKWIPLTEGSVQIIRSGNGVSHSEKINRGSRMFQIWFDPGLEQSLRKKASYDDFAPDKFKISEASGVRKKIIRGDGSPLQMDSPNRIEEWWFGGASLKVEIPQGWVLSYFQITGETKINDTVLEEGDFVKISDATNASFEVLNSAGEFSHRAFLIWTPEKLSYRTYFQL